MQMARIIRLLMLIGAPSIGASLITSCSGGSTTVARSMATSGETSAGGDRRAMQSAAIWRSGMDTLVARVDALDRIVVALDIKATDPAGSANDNNANGIVNADLERARAAFIAARVAFKGVELALEYYAPSTSRDLNGAALPHVEEQEGPDIVTAPTGFQVVEEVLFGEAPLNRTTELRHEVRALQQIVTRAATMIGAQIVTDDRVWDASKLEIARITTLGITGFDSPVAGHSLNEAVASLDGIERTLQPYRTESPAWRTMDSLMSGARAALQTGVAPERFDYLAFIVQFANPLGRALHAERAALRIGVPDERRAFRMQAATLFDADAFDVLAFAPLDVRTESSERIALGRTLFRDTRLSGDNSRACSSCHIPERAFADGMKASAGRQGQPLPRNTPTVINIGLQVGSFSDLRTTYLEDQVTEVVQNPDEMHARLTSVAAQLGADASLAASFRKAFADQPIAKDSVVTSQRIRSALASYLRSLTAMSSPADRALRGNTDALSSDERAGFNVFVGKGKCATCHFLPLTNGTAPPMYHKTDVEVLGVPAAAVTARAKVDPDVGRYRIAIAAPNKYAFRTPTLRNVSLTAPYMHNGAYRTLEAVIDFYDRGGGAGIGLSLEHQTLPASPLKLTATEKRQLVRFLGALTDTTGTQR